MTAVTASEWEKFRANRKRGHRPRGDRVFFEASTTRAWVTVCRQTEIAAYELERLKGFLSSFMKCSSRAEFGAIEEEYRSWLLRNRKGDTVSIVRTDTLLSEGALRDSIREQEKFVEQEAHVANMLFTASLGDIDRVWNAHVALNKKISNTASAADAVTGLVVVTLATASAVGTYDQDNLGAGFIAAVAFALTGVVVVVPVRILVVCIFSLFKITK